MYINYKINTFTEYQVFFNNLVKIFWLAKIRSYIQSTISWVDIVEGCLDYVTTWVLKSQFLYNWTFIIQGLYPTLIDFLWSFFLQEQKTSLSSWVNNFTLSIAIRLACCCKTEIIIIKKLLNNLYLNHSFSDKFKSSFLPSHHFGEPSLNCTKMTSNHLAVGTSISSTKNTWPTS